MLIHELAKTTGFSTDTIRYYEKLGVIAPPVRRENGYRDYPPLTVACLKLCRKAKDLGFSLQELRELGKLLDSRQLNSRTMKTRLRSKLKEIDRRIAKLQKLRDDITKTLESPSVFAV